MAWGDLSKDPDSGTLASWLRTGAPLGFSQSIPNTGIFPPVDAVAWEAESANQLRRSFEEWSNHPSAIQWKTDLVELINDAKSKGFCSIYNSFEEATSALGAPPVLNKLGVIVKEKETQHGTVRKARIIWDMKESGINKLCSQGERIILPKVQ
eukprot:Skav223266  [mRNA]  locus=scaffold2738:4612:5070:- [translate_table: standard]